MLMRKLVLMAVFTVVGIACGSSTGAGGDLCRPGFACTGEGVFWASTEQTAGAPWGFSPNGVECEHPIGTAVTCSDANGANVSKVPDPLGGPGYAIRHYAVVEDAAGSTRAQVGVWWPYSDDFNNAMTSGQQVYFSEELYFPEEIVGTGEYPWLNILDIHSIDYGGGNRTANRPAFMIMADFRDPPGPMYLGLDWMHDTPVQASAPFPVGRWFTWEFSYRWTKQPDATMQVWIDGELVLTQHNVQTADASNDRVEFYLKAYTGRNGPSGHWSPDPIVYYRRNARWASSPLTH